jgi:hypothetical protein
MLGTQGSAQVVAKVETTIALAYCDIYTTLRFTTSRDIG